MYRHRLAIIRLFVAALAAATPHPASADAWLFRISTENTADHVQTRTVARFADELGRRAGGRLAVSHHHSAALFRDRDVVKALRQGRVEMAVPGTWQLDRLEPSVGIFLLPAFYGREAPAQDTLRDGEIGNAIARRIEANLDLHVLGRWIDLGFTHVFGVRRDIARHADLAGMRIRVAGGEANLQRLAALGAEARVIAWPDLPRALADGTVDGILTSHETVVSARLWEMGVASAFEDHQYFAYYIPLVSGSAWARLPPDLRDLAARVWEESVADARAEAARAQAEARSLLAARGVRIHRPSGTALDEQRQRLMAAQPAMAAAMGIDPALVERAMALMGQPR